MDPDDSPFAIFVKKMLLHFRGNRHEPLFAITYLR
jgi:hypothetical protein